MLVKHEDLVIFPSKENFLHCGSVVPNDLPCQRFWNHEEPLTFECLLLFQKLPVSNDGEVRFFHEVDFIWILIYEAIIQDLNTVMEVDVPCSIEFNACPLS